MPEKAGVPSPIQVTFGKVKLLPDGDIAAVKISKFDQEIHLTKAQARTLANVILKHLGPD